jgi:hypothetical protein
MTVARSTFHIASVENGESAVSYEIALDTNSVTADGNTGKFLTTKLGKYHFVKYTGSKAEDCADILDTFNFLILLIGKNGDVLTGGSTSGSASGEIYDLFSGGSIKEENVSQIKFFWYSAPIIKLGDYNYLKNLEKSQGIPTKNMPFTILASNTFLIVRQGADGKPGGKGDPGARGSSGPVWRQHVGFVSATADAPYQYYAGSNDERFLDVVLIDKVWYRCLQSYKSTGTDDIRNTMTNAEFAKYWTSADMANFTFIATQFLLAENAKINLFGSNEINLYGSDAEGKIFASFRVPNGNGDDSLYALWIGAETGAAAPYSVTKAGHMKGTDVDLSGKINAVEGSLGNMTITGTLGVVGAGQGITITKDSIECYRNDEYFAGDNVVSVSTKRSSMVFIQRKQTPINGVFNSRPIIKITSKIGSLISTGNISYTTQGTAVEVEGDINMSEGNIYMFNGSLVGSTRKTVIQTNSNIDLNEGRYESGMILVCNNSSDISVKLPSASAYRGDYFTMIKIGAAKVNVYGESYIPCRGGWKEGNGWTCSTRYEHTHFLFDGYTWYSECTLDT